MNKALTIGLAAAAMIAAMPLAAWADDAQASPADAGLTPYYERGPRIIHVPRADEVDERVPVRVDLDRQDPPRARRHVYRDAAPPQQHKKPAPKRHADLPPRRKPYSALPPPPPSGPRRAVLNAPPPAGGLSPHHLTPRLEAVTDSAEKFAAPGDPATPTPVVSATNPPPGYTPPTVSLPAKPAVSPNAQPAVSPQPE
ncbi:MAG TPA: hypothetical protein VFC54_09720 [Pseudolabrys sp.]|nr:hypothetical protein [Pseudolabrys sp.]